MYSQRSTPSSSASGLGKTLAPLVVFTLLGLLVYHRALSLGFFADDAWALYFSRTNWLLPNPESPHYPPLYFAIHYGLYKTFGLNPFPYHLFNLGVAILNAALVKILAADLELETWQCWTAGLLVLFNSVAAEVYFWFSIVNTVMMVTAVVAGLICLLRFRLSRAWGWGAGYLALVFLAASLDAKGMILPLLGILLSWGWAGEDDRWPREGLRIHLFSFGIIAGLLLVRWLWGIKSATIHLPLRDKWETFTTTLTSTFFRGLDNHLWGWLQGYPTLWKIVPWMLILLLPAILAWGWLRTRGRDRRRFLALVLLWITSVFPHTLAANLQFRYFYLPGVFAALVIVNLLEILRQRLANGKGYLRVGLVVLAILALDLRGLHLALNSFQEASRIYEAGIRSIREKLPAPAPGTNLILVDFPTFIYSRQGARTPRAGNIPYVYVFPQALPYHLQLMYRLDEIGVTLVHMAPPSPENPRPLGTAATLGQVRAMLDRPHTLAWRYLPGETPNFVEIKEKETPGKKKTR